MSRSEGTPGERRTAAPRVLTLVILAALLTAACGARVAPYEATLAAGGVRAGTPAAGTSGAGALGGSQPGATSPGGSGAASTPGGGAVGSSTGSPGNAVSGTPNAAAGGSSTPTGTGTGAAQTPASATQLTPQNFPYDPAAEAALCQGSTGNTSSDQGVTPTSITFGNVSGLTGILSNNFNQGPEAVQALFKAINAAGGICGRQLILDVEDDGQDATKNASDVQDLAPRVFAFVGSTSDGDNGGTQAMISAKTPDFGFAINGVRGDSPEYWSAGGAPQNFVNGHPYIFNTLPNALKVNGNFPKKMAVLAYSIPISADAGQQFLNLFDESGSTNCFSDFSVSPVTASLDSDVLQMKQRGCDGVFTTMDVTGNAKLYQAMQRQGFKPAFNGTTFDGYTPAQINVAGSSAAQGLEVNLPFLEFNSNNPIINQYLSQLSTYEPGKQPSGFGIEAWASAQMMLYALVKAGRNPTRASLTAALTAITTWSTGGATSPLTPRTHVGGPCGMEVTVNNGAFQRKWPASGFYCNGVETKVG